MARLVKPWLVTMTLLQKSFKPFLLW